MVATDQLAERAIADILGTERPRRRWYRRRIVRYLAAAAFAADLAVTGFLLWNPPAVTDRAHMMVLAILTQQIADEPATSYDAEIHALRRDVGFDRFSVMTPHQADQAIRRQLDRLETLRPELYRSLGLKP